MVLAKSKNAVGLGNRYAKHHGRVPLILTSSSLMNDRFGKGKGADRKKVTSAGIQRINHATGETVSSPLQTSISTQLTSDSMSQMSEKRPAGSRCDQLLSK
jgi:hypothetical protein